MDPTDLEERFRRMLAQTEHFLRVDQCVDALGRARLCLREVREAIARADDPDEKTRLERIERRAVRHVELCETAHAEWSAKVAERAHAFAENEARKYDAPLPGEGID